MWCYRLDKAKVCRIIQWHAMRYNEHAVFCDSSAHGLLKSTQCVMTSFRELHSTTCGYVCTINKYVSLTQ